MLIGGGCERAGLSLRELPSEESRMSEAERLIVGSLLFPSGFCAEYPTPLCSSGCRILPVVLWRGSENFAAEQCKARKPILKSTANFILPTEEDARKLE